MPARSAARSTAPLDQADGLRRLFGGERLRFIPLVANPLVPGVGVVMERLCAALAEHGLHTLVVDAADTATPPHELAAVDLAACVEPLAPQVSYLAARGLPVRWLDARATMAGFLDALRQAAPAADVVLLHASAQDLRRMFAGRTPSPVLVAGNRPDSLTGAYAAMKQLTQRLGALTFDLVIASDVGSRRGRRMVDRLAECADHFLASALRHAAVVDPLAPPRATVPAGLRRLVAAQLQPPGSPEAAAALPPGLAGRSAAAGLVAHADGLDDEAVARPSAGLRARPAGQDRPAHPDHPAARDAQAAQAAQAARLAAQAARQAEAQRDAEVLREAEAEAAQASHLHQALQAAALRAAAAQRLGSRGAGAPELSGPSGPASVRAAGGLRAAARLLEESQLPLSAADDVALPPAPPAGRGLRARAASGRLN